MREEITPSREGESIAGCVGKGRKEADEVVGVQFGVGVAGGKATPKDTFHLFDPERGFVAIAEGTGLVTPDPLVPRTACAVAHTSFRRRFGEGRALVRKWGTWHHRSESHRCQVPKSLSPLVESLADS